MQKKEEKNPVGRPKLANSKTKKEFPKRPAASSTLLPCPGFGRAPPAALWTGIV